MTNLFVPRVSVSLRERERERDFYGISTYFIFLFFLSSMLFLIGIFEFDNIIYTWSMFGHIFDLEAYILQVIHTHITLWKMIISLGDLYAY